MKIVIDTREQLPLEFNHPFITEVECAKLEVGDYSCVFNDGYSPPFRFERKGISDLFGTLSKGYERFKKEINRSIEEKVILIIIIEGSLSKVLQGYDRSKRSGDEIVQQLFTLMLRHRVPHIFCRDRIEMQRFITEFYLACGREHVRKCQTSVASPEKSS